jgi:uncharacterized membrane-anchored protein
MSRNRILALVFLGVALLQVALPASRILLYEKTLAEGRAFKFKTAPVDPYDAFRGRYVALGFDARDATWTPEERPEYGTQIFARLETDAEGYAKFGEATLDPPSEGDYLKVTAGYMDKDKKLGVAVPFDRFYMEEGIAPEAEKVYREGTRVIPFNEPRRDIPAHAVIRIRDGLGVIEQVYIGEKTLAEAARAALTAHAK